MPAFNVRHCSFDKGKEPAMLVQAFMWGVMIFAMTGAVDAQPPSSGWLPDGIEWGKAAADGTRYALLEGERNGAGTPFSYAFSIPAGVWDSPHFHSTTARVFVVTGELRIGYGADGDRRKVQAYPAGSYLIVPAGVVHYDGADQNTTIIGVASGPWKTTYLQSAGPVSAGTPDASR